MSLLKSHLYFLEAALGHAIHTIASSSVALAATHDTWSHLRWVAAKPIANGIFVFGVALRMTSIPPSFANSIAKDSGAFRTSNVSLAPRFSYLNSGVI